MTILQEKDRELWRSVCTRFSNYGLSDVYFRLEYISLYGDNDSKIEGFLYEESGETFFFPYLKRKVLDQPEVLYDFETAYGYGGPLSTTQNPGFLEAAWDSFLVHAQEQGMFAGFIRFHPLLKNEKYAAVGYIETVFMRPTVMLRLNRSEEEVWSQQYISNTRNKISKAKRSGVTIEQTRGEKALLQFSKLYHQTMEEVGAAEAYLFGNEYFTRLGKQLEGCYEVYLAHHKGKCIGGVLTLNSEDYVHLHLSATERETRNLGTANLLRHTAIMANLYQRKIFHFGGGNSNDIKDSLFRFKKGFSQELSEFFVGKVLLDKAIYQEVCAKWQRDNLSKRDKHNQMFLKYRF